MAEHTYWVQYGIGLSRWEPLKGGGFTNPEDWNGREWKPSDRLVEQLSKGEPTYDEVTEAEARERFPAAFT